MPTETPSWDAVAPVDPKATHVQVNRSLEFEAAVRRRLCEARRVANRQGTELARSRTHATKRAARIAVREDIDRRVGRDVTRQLEMIPPAMQPEVEQLSRLINDKMSIFADPRARGWFRMFKHLDDDGTGRISFKEVPFPEQISLPSAAGARLWVTQEDRTHD